MITKRTIHAKNCRCCNQPVRDHRQLSYGKHENGGYYIAGYVPAQTCTNPACKLHTHTIDHVTVRLELYGATEHPDWRIEDQSIEGDA